MPIVFQGMADVSEKTWQDEAVTEADSKSGHKILKPTTAEKEDEEEVNVVQDIDVDTSVDQDVDTSGVSISHDEEDEREDDVKSCGTTATIDEIEDGRTNLALSEGRQWCSMTMKVFTSTQRQEIPDEWHGVTTVILKNLPHWVMQQLLIDQLMACGFVGTYDYVYVPVNTRTDRIRGYAFINFVHSDFAWAFKQRYEADLAPFQNVEATGKRLQVTPAALQGLEANYVASMRMAGTLASTPRSGPLFLSIPTIPSSPGNWSEAMTTAAIPRTTAKWRGRRAVVTSRKANAGEYKNTNLRNPKMQRTLRKMQRNLRKMQRTLAQAVKQK
jgi:hypothetical protein